MKTLDDLPRAVFLEATCWSAGQNPRQMRQRTLTFHAPQPKKGSDRVLDEILARWVLAIASRNV